jgi:truncated hemoglobin YjbI
MSEPLNRKREFRTVAEQRARHVQVLESALNRIGITSHERKWLAERLVEQGVRVKLP